MHSRIFCVCAKGDTDTRNEILDTTESEMHDMCTCIPCFDYCVECGFNKEDFNWLLEQHKFIIKTGTNTFKVDKQLLEKDILDNLQEAKDIINTIHTLEDWQTNLYRLTDKINEENGFYMYQPCAIDTLTYFGAYADDTEYEIVTIYDYHF